MSHEQFDRGYSLHEQLAQNVERKFWKGPDIAAASAITIDKVANVPITVTPESLPPLYGLQVDVLRDVRASTRSRYAQIGFDVHEAVGMQIAQWVMTGRHQALDGSIPQSFEAQALVFNHSTRPIHVEAGAQLFRLYYDLARPVVRGQELVEAFKSGEIAIQGEKGVDWDWATTTGVDPESEDEIYGVAVRIKDEDRKWIPPHPDNTPVSISDNHGDYRAEVDQYHTAIPKTNRQILWIGETVKMTLQPSVNTLLDKAVTRTLRPNTLDEFTGIQLNSRLIDSGKTDWGIRVEVVSATIPSQIPHFVHFHFVRE